MKTKIKNNKSYKKPLIFITIFVIVFATGFGLLYWKHTADTKDKKGLNDLIIKQEINYEEPTGDQIQAGIDQKQSNQAPRQNSPNLIITSANVSDGVLRIRLDINDIISSNGTCELVLKSNTTQAIVNKQVSTYALPSSSTCAGFDINTNELSPGKWLAEISVEIDDSNLFISKEISI